MWEKESVSEWERKEKKQSFVYEIIVFWKTKHCENDLFFFLYCVNTVYVSVLYYSFLFIPARIHFIASITFVRLFRLEFRFDCWMLLFKFHFSTHSIWDNKNKYSTWLGEVWRSDVNVHSYSYSYLYIYNMTVDNFYSHLIHIVVWFSVFSFTLNIYFSFLAPHCVRMRWYSLLLLFSFQILIEYNVKFITYLSWIWFDAMIEFGLSEHDLFGFILGAFLECTRDACFTSF